MNQEEDSAMYRVLVNEEQQHSLWPLRKESPAGWRDAGKSGSKDECLAFVREVWTDIRPLSLQASLRGTVGTARSSRNEA